MENDRICKSLYPVNPLQSVRKFVRQVNVDQFGASNSRQVELNGVVAGCNKLEAQSCRFYSVIELLVLRRKFVANLVGCIIPQMRDVTKNKVDVDQRYFATYRMVYMKEIIQLIQLNVNNYSIYCIFAFVLEVCKGLE